MISFKSLDDILRITLQWEQRLGDFYDVAEIAMQNEESKRVVALLRNKLTEKLRVLESIDLNKFGKTEWIRYAPDYKEDELFSTGKIQRQSSPQEIFTHLANYEEKLKNVYARIAESLIAQTQKELFESLAQFKGEQIEEINRLMVKYKKD